MGPHLDDDVSVEAAHPAVVIGEVRSLVGRGGGVKLGDRRVTVDVEMRDLQLYAARDSLSGQAGERRVNELAILT